MGLNLELQALFPSQKENAPRQAGHYLILVARGGINRGQGCLILLAMYRDV